jgi:hypothetical protein
MYSAGVHITNPLSKAFDKSIYLGVPGVQEIQFSNLISFVFRPSGVCGGGGLSDSISRDHKRQRDTNTLAVKALLPNGNKRLFYRDAAR